MESSVNYDHPIEGDPMNNILDSRYAFRVLRDTRISLDKSSLLYLLQFRDRQIFLNLVFPEIFFSIYYRLLLTLR